MDDMLNPVEIRGRLAEGAAAALRGDRTVLEEIASWLDSASARELLRIDDFARQFRYEGPVLGKSQQWTEEILDRSLPAVTALASMHPDGFVRERAVRSLVMSSEPGSDRTLTVRVSDHVSVIREAAAGEVLQRMTLEQADRIMPLLHRIEQRGRGADVLPLYLHSLVTVHGEAKVWARLRASGDRDMRRAAFQFSLASGLLTPDGAVELLPREKDQIIRRLLTRVIADTAPAEVVTQVLLRGRAADSRALGLVRLTASELHPEDAERLLVDSSVLVRLWARRRWEEMGRDPATTYAAVARSGAKPVSRARAYVGLAETNAAIEREEILDLVHSDELALRKVGLILLKGKAAAEDVPALFVLAAADNSRLARLASEVLTHNPRLWSVPDLAALKAAEAPELRRRAWWIHRNRGGWEAVIADLELLHDPDPHLAVLGGQPVAPMYFQPTEPQKQRIAHLLRRSRLKRSQVLSIALAAGLREFLRNPDESAVSREPAVDPAIPGRRWWKRLWNRDNGD
jgi:hypothetical protein